MDFEHERMQILELIESGQISASEGLRWIERLQATQEPDADLPEAIRPSPGADFGMEEPVSPTGSDRVEDPAPAEAGSVHATPLKPVPNLPPGAARWRRWWQAPLWAGVSVLLLGSLWMYQALQASGVGFWFLCASLPFLLGLGLVVLAWQARRAPWLHLRITQKPGEWPQRIAFSLPVPVELSAWLFRTFQHRIPGLQDTAVDQVILALGQNATPDNPIYIEVDEGEDGEHVEIFIG